MPLAHSISSVLGVCGVLVLDRVRQRQWSLLMAGLLDEAAHIATALLTHLAVGLPRTKLALLGSVAGATLLDADHVPHHLGWRLLTRDTERPLTHSASTVGVIAVAALLAPKPLRWLVASAAVGTATQLIRDVGTGPIPLWWPISRREVRAPYAVYVMYLLACVLAIVRLERK